MSRIGISAFEYEIFSEIDFKIFGLTFIQNKTNIGYKLGIRKILVFFRLISSTTNIISNSTYCINEMNKPEFFSIEKVLGLFVLIQD